MTGALRAAAMSVAGVTECRLYPDPHGARPDALAVELHVTESADFERPIVAAALAAMFQVPGAPPLRLAGVMGTL